MSVCDLIRAVLMPSSSAFFHSNIFLRGFLTLLGVMRVSHSTIS
jgi:hypothetical protein